MSHISGLTIQSQQPNLRCCFSGSDANYPTKLQRPDSATHYPQVSRTQSFVSCPSTEINRPYSNYGHETSLYNINATYPSNQLSGKPEKDLLDMLIQSQIQCDKLAQKLREQLVKRSTYDQQRAVQNTQYTNLQPDCSQYRGTEQPYPCMQTFNSTSNLSFPQLPNQLTLTGLPADSIQLDMNNNNNYNATGNYVNSFHPAARLQSWLSPLVARYNDLFTNTRVQAMNQLQANGQADYERSQRIIFYTVQVCFAITRQYLRRLYPNHYGEVTNNCKVSYQGEELYQEIPLNPDQITVLTNAVQRRLVRRPPPECACRVNTFASESPYYSTAGPLRGTPVTPSELDCLVVLIREMCSLAWFLLVDRRSPPGSPVSQTLLYQQQQQQQPYQYSDCRSGLLRVWHVDVDRSAKPSDTYDEKCYRRSFDSNSSTGTVHHYVWPCLLLFSRSPSSNSCCNSANFFQSNDVGYENAYYQPTQLQQAGDTTVCVLVKENKQLNRGLVPHGVSERTGLINYCDSPYFFQILFREFDHPSSNFVIPIRRFWR
ncbi:hypothetical protein PHET_09479 [Paragonimus heterotremus]|uniref:Mitochondria-eating protein n=1 Tax=Paragonimus heterotremus TaxID=100268 RepID=A0A8J4T0X0_9TREM|nr:hypothetical protein PHET_09479 [Paragonimus heterotremus]